MTEILVLLLCGFVGGVIAYRAFAKRNPTV